MPDPTTSKYAGERYDPTLPFCGDISLQFDGQRLRLVGTKIGPIDYKAVSGKPSTEKTFDYSPDRQKARNSGPIPEGTYWINPAELWENAWWRQMAPRSSWGNFRITIHPFTTTETHTRGGFFIHGGNAPGSAGCVDLTNDMDRFVKDLRKYAGERDCQIHITVAYPNSPPAR